VKKPTLSYPYVRVDAAGSVVVSHAGGVLLVEAVRASGLGRALSAGLARWRKQLMTRTYAVGGWSPWQPRHLT